jgi:hypothetical protein
MQENVGQNQGRVLKAKEDIWVCENCGLSIISRNLHTQEMLKPYKYWVHIGSGLNQCKTTFAQPKG